MIHLDKLLVGALTSKPYAFTARSWELKNLDSIDVFDAVGSNIKISTRGSSVLRILPKVNDRLNEEWISDKARFSYDALKFQRVLYCYKKSSTGTFSKIDWPKFFSFLIPQNNQPNSEEFFALTKPSDYSLNFYCGHFTDINTLSVLSYFNSAFKLRTLGVVNSSLPLLDCDLRSSFVFRDGINNLDKRDAIFLVGSNPRLEAPALNLKIRKSVLFNSTKVYCIGFSHNLTYASTSLGNCTSKLVSLLEGKLPVSRKFNNFSNPLFLYGSSFAQVSGSEYLVKYFKNSNKRFNSASFLLPEASSANFLELGNLGPTSLSGTVSGKTIDWFLNEDKSKVLSNTSSLKLYQGHHGDLNSALSDVILPSTTFSEKNSILINMQGDVQKTRFSDSSVLTKDVRDDLVTLETILGSKHGRTSSIYGDTDRLDDSFQFDSRVCGSCFRLPNTSLYYYMQDFYRNDPLTRNSPVMALTSNRINSKKSIFQN